MQHNLDVVLVRPVIQDIEIFYGKIASAGGGLFTSTNPEIRRVVPENVNGRTKLKVVYVVLEAQYQSALTAAVKNINATRDKVRKFRQILASKA